MKIRKTQFMCQTEGLTQWREICYISKKTRGTTNNGYTFGFDIFRVETHDRIYTAASQLESSFPSL